MYQITRGFQQRIVSGSLTYAVALLLTICFWFVSYSLVNVEYYDYSFLNWEFKIPAFWSYLLGFFAHWGISLLLIQENNVFSIIRVRTTIHSSIYLLLVACMPELHSFSMGLLAFFFVFFSFHILFKRFQDDLSQGMAFHQYMLVGFASLIDVKFLLFVPILWIGAITFRAASSRSFAASLLGLLFPYWIAIGYLALSNQIHLLYEPIIHQLSWPGFSWQFTPWPMYSISLLLFLFLLGAFHTFAKNYEDKIQTRVYLHYIIFEGIVLFIISFIWPENAIVFLPFGCVCCAYIYGHFLAVTNNKFSLFTLLFSLVAMGILSLFNIWMLF